MTITDFPAQTSLAQWTREFNAALHAYSFAQSNHKASAATRLKQAIIAAYSHGLLTDEQTQEMIRGYRLEGVA